MKEQNTNQMSTRQVIEIHRRALRDIQKMSPYLLPSTVLYAVVSAVIPYVTVFFSARILNELAGQRRPDALWFWVILTVAVGGVLALLSAVLLRVKTAQQDLFYDRKERMYTGKMFSLDYADVDNQQARGLLSKARQNENWGGWGFYKVPIMAEDLTKAAAGILSAVVLSVSLFTQPVPASAGWYTVLNNPLFILPLLGAMVCITALSGWCSAKAITMWSKISEKATFGNRFFSFWTDFGSDHKRTIDIRIYRQYEISKRIFKLNNSFSPKGPIAKLARGSMGVLTGLSASVSAVFTGFVYVFTCLKALGGAFGVGSVTQYVGAVTSLSQNLAKLYENWGTLQANASFLQPAYQFLDIPNRMYQGSLTTEKRSDRKYQVEFRDVSFRYPGAKDYALRHVSVQFQVGERMAVVGENGSGKSTFIKLLCRLYDPQEGQILLNGIDIRKYNYRDYMGIFSVVFQDFQLLSQPLGENVAGCAAGEEQDDPDEEANRIRLGKYSLHPYNRQRIRKALIDAGFGDRLSTMPKGLDTQLYKDFSDDGVEVSGGEAQKIAIARALYKDAPFIILDEPTAALDPIAEAEIYAQLDQIVGDKTAIYISHRLSSCRFCDEILVFDRGQIVQKGSHDALLACQGLYAQLWNAQAQYYANEAE